MSKRVVVLLTCLLTALSTCAATSIEEFDSALSASWASLPESWPEPDGTEYLLDIMGIRISLGPALENRLLYRPTQLQRSSAEAWNETEVEGGRCYKTTLSLGLVRAAADVFLFQFGPDHKIDGHFEASLGNASFGLAATVRPATVSQPCSIETETSELDGSLVISSSAGTTIGYVVKCLMSFVNIIFPSFKLYPFFSQYQTLILNELTKQLVLSSFCNV